MLALATVTTMEQIITYQPFDGQNGLDLAQGQLSAYYQGQIVGQSATEVKDVQQLLDSYQPQHLLEDLQFSYDGSRRQMLVTIALDFTLSHILMGSMETNEQRSLWRAARKGSNVFLLQDELPENSRPWVEDERGKGWEITLPAFISVDPDPVLRQRAALAIEALIYSLQTNREIDFPYQRSFDNVFSSKNPTWPQPLPLVS